MALKTRFIRDNRHRIMGTVVSGYQDGSEIVKNFHGQVVGRVLPKPGITKNQQNQITHLTADSGFFFGYSEADDE